MARRIALLFVLALLALPGSIATSARAADDRPPNLILIMADDLGAAELSCYGHPRHRTPHLDRLAQTGVQFATCYTACICHPTRFEIMTGQYGSTNGVYQFAGRPGGPDPDAPEEQIVNHLTFGTLLQEAGYATAHAGKWQLTGTVPDLVVENGFDEYCMWAYKHNLPAGVEHTGGWEGRAGRVTSRYWHPSILRNGEYVPTTIDDYGPDIFTDFVIDFARRNRERPFFIYYPMVLTHNPWYATPASTPDRTDKFRNSKEDHFGENVEYMDTLVGRIVAAIEELGLREQTVILFTADNGTRGAGKGEPTELGARVPMIVNGPSRVQPAGLTDALVDTSDVLPTLVELAGARLPGDHSIDGRSFAPILRGERSDVRKWIFSYLADQRVLRTKRYLLERNSPADFGTLYDCGDSRDGTGYTDVTSSDAPEVQAVREQFRAILATKPVPEMPARRQKRASRDRSAP